MMLEEEELHKLALLARLEFEPDELNHLGCDLQEIIAYMQELVNAQVPNIPAPEAAAALRPDISQADASAAVSQASDKHEGWIRLPRVVP